VLGWLSVPAGLASLSPDAQVPMGGSDWWHRKWLGKTAMLNLGYLAAPLIA